MTEGGNPLMQPSTLQYEAPDFSVIKAEHFAPALDAAMAESLAEVEAIVSSAEPATFENTVERLELGSRFLTRVQLVFLNLCAANTSPELQALEQQYLPRFALHRDRIWLNDALYARVMRVYADRDGLAEEPRRLVEFYERQFTLAGAALSSAAKEELMHVNEKLAALQGEFSAKLLRAREASAVLFADADALRGLSEVELKRAQREAEALQQNGHDGELKAQQEGEGRAKYALTLLNTTQQPFFVALHNRDTRRQLYEVSLHRNDGTPLPNASACIVDESDTRAICLETARLRLRKANLLGFRSFAEWKLQDQMATVPLAEQLLRDIGTAAVRKARAEASELEAFMESQHVTHELNPWDWVYYAEQLRKEKFDFDENELKPYFELLSVLEQGCFFAAEQLYGVTLKRRYDLPVYNADMLSYELFDANGTSLALYFLDPYARPNKRGGAWMTSYVKQSLALQQKPVVHNVLNIPKPAAGEPTLLSFRNVTTLFHEFGHGLHGMLSHVNYPSLSGTSVARDFLEFPSQINEKWASYDTVLHHYARHYKTRAVMPDALFAKMKAADTFAGGFETVELVKAAAIDLYWHTITDEKDLCAATAMDEAGAARYGIVFDLIPARYLSTYFAHIFQGGYAAGYYAYLWSKLLDCDGFEWLLEHGGLTRENGEHLRKTVLSVGNTADAKVLYEHFAGRQPNINAYLRSRGLLAEDKTPNAAASPWKG